MAIRIDCQTGRPRKRILFVSWFINHNQQWLGEHLNRNKYEYNYVGLPFRLDTTKQRAGLRNWAIFFLLAIKARWHLFWNKYDFVVSAFPQVGFALETIKLLTFEKTPHILWSFNCGHEYRGLSRFLSRVIFRRACCFIVYTNKEREIYSEVFSIPLDRFRFTYLTGPELDWKTFEGTGKRLGIPQKYIASLGSSSRDYRTLFEAVAGASFQTVVVTQPYCLKDLEIPRNVKILQSINPFDYLGIIAEAEIVVIPVDNIHTASGQMTMIQAMGLGVPVVATKCIGMEDYIHHGETGYFVEMHDEKGLRCTIDALMENSGERQRIADNALEFAKKHFNDSSGSDVLDQIIEGMAKAGE